MIFGKININMCKFVLNVLYGKLISCYKERGRLFWWVGGEE